jgi:hypothetical protein
MSQILIIFNFFIRIQTRKKISFQINEQQKKNVKNFSNFNINNH